MKFTCARREANVIDQKNFQVLRDAFALASSKNLLLYDIDGAYDIPHALQRSFVLPEVFGQLEKALGESSSSK